MDTQKYCILIKLKSFNIYIYTNKTYYILTENKHIIIMGKLTIDFSDFTNKYLKKCNKIIRKYIPNMICIENVKEHIIYKYENKKTNNISNCDTLYMYIKKKNDNNIYCKMFLKTVDKDIDLIFDFYAKNMKRLYKTLKYYILDNEYEMMEYSIYAFMDSYNYYNNSNLTIRFYGGGIDDDLIW